jgi:hypothetical protein
MLLMEIAMHLLPFEPPGDPKATAPPGADGILMLLGWTKWLALAIAIAGLMITGARMAISHRRGEGGEHGAAIAWVLAGVIIISGGWAILMAIVGA